MGGACPPRVGVLVGGESRQKLQMAAERRRQGKEVGSLGKRSFRCIFKVGWSQKPSWKRQSEGVGGWGRVF